MHAQKRKEALHEPPQRRGRAPERGVYKATIAPHWFENNAKFWYRNDLRDGAREFIVVDAQQGTRRPAFDHERLASALSKAAGQEFKGRQLPFSEIEFTDDGQGVRFDAAGKTWQCTLNSYECAVAPASPAPAEAQSPESPGPGEGGQDRRAGERASPDGKWTAYIKDRNVFVRKRSR